MTLFDENQPLPIDDDADPFAYDEPAETPTKAQDTKGPQPMTTPNQTETAAEATRALLALMQTATPAIDADQVKALIREEAGAWGKAIGEQFEAMLTAKLATAQPRAITLEIGEYKSAEIEGPLPANFFRVVKLMNARQNTLLVGPAGCGKTHTAEIAAEALGLQFASISCTAGISEAHFTGRLLPTGEGGKFEYSRSEFVRLYEEGGCFLIDEIDAADPNVLLVINTALSNGHMATPARVDKPQAKRHADFVCVATANTYGTGADRVFVGREQLDESTLRRFRMGTVSCDYDDSVESALVDSRLLTWARALREKLTATKMRRFISTGELLDGTKLLLTKSATWESLMDSYFSGWTADERAKVGELCPAQPYNSAIESAGLK